MLCSQELGHIFRLFFDKLASFLEQNWFNLLDLLVKAELNLVHPFSKQVLHRFELRLVQVSSAKDRYRTLSQCWLFFKAISRLESANAAKLAVHFRYFRYLVIDCLLTIEARNCAHLLHHWSEGFRLVPFAVQSTTSHEQWLLWLVPYGWQITRRIKQFIFLRLTVTWVILAFFSIAAKALVFFISFAALFVRFYLLIFCFHELVGLCLQIFKLW